MDSGHITAKYKSCINSQFNTIMLDASWNYTHPTDFIRKPLPI